MNNQGYDASFSFASTQSVASASDIGDDVDDHDDDDEHVEDDDWRGSNNHISTNTSNTVVGTDSAKKMKDKEGLNNQNMADIQAAAASRLATATGRPYHFGTHYSSSATVVHYLLRLQPYTSAHVHFQGYACFSSINPCVIYLITDHPLFLCCQGEIRSSRSSIPKC